MSTESSASLSKGQRVQLAFGRNFFSRYKERNKLNRYVVLVLVWNSIIWFIVGQPTLVSNNTDSDWVAVMAMVQPYTLEYSKAINLLPIVFWALAVFVSAWLYGWKYKLPSLVSVGMAVLGVGIFVEAFLRTISAATEQDNSIWMRVLTIFAKILVSIGGGISQSTTLQLAIEQIPGASGTQLSSIISWFIFSTALGMWLHSFIKGLYKHCAPFPEAEYSPTLYLIYAAIVAFALCTNAICCNKLTDYSKTSNNIKQIYYVLKYAAQHKYPEDRDTGAFYKRSRLDNGKRRNGGPFTNEEVEEVRTFIQIFFLCTITFVYTTTLYMNGYSLAYLDFNYNYSQNNCSNFIGSSFRGWSTWWLVPSILGYELVFVPVFYLRMPSMMSRVMSTGVIVTILSALETILVITYRYHPVTFSADFEWMKLGLALPMGMLQAIYFIAGLEFICAQSPYSMRTFFVCLALFTVWFSQLVAAYIFTLWRAICSSEGDCAVIYTTIALVLVIVVLVIFCVCGKCYRKRTRDEIESTENYDDTVSIT